MKKLNSYLKELEKAMDSAGLRILMACPTLIQITYYHHSIILKALEKITNVTVLGDLFFLDI